MGTLGFRSKDITRKAEKLRGEVLETEIGQKYLEGKRREEEALNPTNPIRSPFRDPNFIASQTNRATQIGETAATNLRNIGARGQAIGARGARELGTVGRVANQAASTAGAAAAEAGERSQAADTRAAPTTNFGAAGQRLGTAEDLASRIAGIEDTPGPSAAQAQLQSGLNQAQRQALALSRSGRGFGQSASATDAALVQQAQLGQEASNQAAVLRAQEDAAQRTRQAQNLSAAAGINLDSAEKRAGFEEFLTGTELSQTQLNDLRALGFSDQELNAISTQLSGLDLQGRSIGQALEAQFAGERLAFGAEGAAAASQFQGQGVGLQIASEQTAIEQADSDRILQKYGIDQGVAMANADRKQREQAAWINFGVTAAATAAGFFVGGPAGAAAGYTLGRGVGAQASGTEDGDFGF